MSALVTQAGAPGGISDLVTGIYEASSPDVTYVPSGWQGSVADASVYTNVVSKSCRNCHDSWDGGDTTLAFRSAADFKANAARIGPAVCGTLSTSAPVGAMPIADAVTDALLAGPGRAYLADYVGAAGDCVYGSP
jgi:hypothetical protein